MIDQANDMEAIRHNAGLGEVQPDQGPVAGGEIHADHARLVLAFQPLKIGLQSDFRAAQDDIVYFVIPQIAQRGRVAVAAGEEVPVDP